MSCNGRACATACRPCAKAAAWRMRLCWNACRLERSSRARTKLPGVSRFRTFWRAFVVTCKVDMLKVCVLASSSSGNCTFIRTDKTRLLIDAGLSKRDTLARLAAIGESVDDLDAILITHEHSDHVAGLGALARHFEA